jgi:hypothetical protein
MHETPFDTESFPKQLLLKSFLERSQYKHILNKQDNL